MNSKQAATLRVGDKVVFHGDTSAGGTVRECGPHAARVEWEDGHVEVLPHSSFDGVERATAPVAPIVALPAPTAMEPAKPRKR